MTVLSPVYQEVIEVFNFIRLHKPKTPPICLGGAYVTTLMEEVFEETPADFAVYGEGEITFSALIDYLKGNEKIEHINGLIYAKDYRLITNMPESKLRI